MNRAYETIGSPEAVAVKVRESDHCDYENPIEPVCYKLCGYANVDYTDAQIQSTIAGLMTSATLFLSGDTNAYEQWWTAGGYWYKELDNTNGGVSGGAGMLEILF